MLLYVVVGVGAGMTDWHGGVGLLSVLALVLCVGFMLLPRRLGAEKWAAAGNEGHHRLKGDGGDAGRGFVATAPAALRVGRYRLTSPK